MRFVSFEAAPALDPTLSVRKDGISPFFWFGLYHSPQIVEDSVPFSGIPLQLEWTPAISENDYSSPMRKSKATLVVAAPTRSTMPPSFAHDFTPIPGAVSN